MNFIHADYAARWTHTAHLLLRVAVGAVFLQHGYQKVFVAGVSNIAGFFESVGVPLASSVAYLVAYGELIGGALLILGLLTRLVAKIDIVILLGAIWFVHLERGFSVSGGGYEFSMVLLAAAFYLLAAGGGKYSFDSFWRRRRVS